MKIPQTFKPVKDLEEKTEQLTSWSNISLGEDAVEKIIKRVAYITRNQEKYYDEHKGRHWSFRDYDSSLSLHYSKVIYGWGNKKVVEDYLVFFKAEEVFHYSNSSEEPKNLICLNQGSWIMYLERFYNQTKIRMHHMK